MLLDAMDRKILSVMQTRSDCTISEIADAVGITTTPCWRRIRKLEASGVILGRVLRLDPKALGLPVSVYAEIRLRQHDEKTLLALEQAVSGQGEIVECYSVSGDADYMMRIVAASIEAYERFLKSVLLHLPGVGSVNSRFALGCVKMTTELPI